MAYDFKVRDRQIVVGDSFVDKEKLNEFFQEHRLFHDEFSDEEICELVYDVALVYEDKMTNNDGFVRIDSMLDEDAFDYTRAVCDYARLQSVARIMSYTKRQDALEYILGGDYDAKYFEEICEECSEYESLFGLNLSMPTFDGTGYVKLDAETNHYRIVEDAWGNVFFDCIMEIVSQAGLDLIAIPSFDKAERDSTFAFLLRGDLGVLKQIAEVSFENVYVFEYDENEPSYLIYKKEIHADNEHDLQMQWLSTIADVSKRLMDLFAEVVMD